MKRSGNESVKSISKRHKTIEQTVKQLYDDMLRLRLQDAYDVPCIQHVTVVIPRNFFIPRMNTGRSCTTCDVCGLVFFSYARRQVMQRLVDGVISLQGDYYNQNVHLPNSIAYEGIFICETCRKYLVTKANQPMAFVKLQDMQKAIVETTRMPAPVCSLIASWAFLDPNGPLPPTCRGCTVKRRLDSSSV